MINIFVQAIKKLFTKLDAIEMEQPEKDREKLVNKGKDINDIKWEFIEEIIMSSNDKKISESDIILIYKYTEKIKKELGLWYCILQTWSGNAKRAWGLYCTYCGSNQQTWEGQINRTKNDNGLYLD